MDVVLHVTLGRLTAEVEAKFTSTDSNGTHYYEIVKPVRITNKRVEWDALRGFPGLLRDITWAVMDYYTEHPQGKFFTYRRKDDGVQQTKGDHCNSS